MLGPCHTRSSVFAESFTDEDPLLRHVRTRVKSPQPMRVDWRLSLSAWVLDDTRRLRGWLPQTMPQVGALPR